MHNHQTIRDGTNKHECNRAWTREHERVICHAVPMIQVKMNNGNIMCFPVCAAGCSKDIYFFLALCSHLPENANGLVSASAFPTTHTRSPQTSKSKEEGKDVVCVYVSCYQSLWASVCLLQSCSSYHRQACRNRDSVSCSLSCGCGPRGRLHPTTGAPTEDPIVPWTYFELKTQGALKAYCEWANSLSSKEAKRVFINYLDPC